MNLSPEVLNALSYNWHTQRLTPWAHTSYIILVANLNNCEQDFYNMNNYQKESFANTKLNMKVWSGCVGDIVK